MLEYRVFLIGGDGHIKAAEELYCTSDGEACHKAEALLKKWPLVEVWNGKRLVGTFQADGGGA